MQSLLRRQAEVPYGYIARCPDCGLASPISDSDASVRLDHEPTNVKECARELFGEENSAEHWRVRDEDIRLGLAKDEDRLDAIGAVFAAVSEHAKLPSFASAPPKHQSIKLRAVIWFAGFIAVLATSLVLSKEPDYWAGVIITSIGMTVGWSLVWAIVFMDSVSPSQQVKRQHKEMLHRLAAGLSQLEPTGHELSLVREFGFQHNFWTAALEPHELLIEIKRVRDQSASTVMQAA